MVDGTNLVRPILSFGLPPTKKVTAQQHSRRFWGVTAIFPRLGLF
jgi:hypothetical protein